MTAMVKTMVIMVWYHEIIDRSSHADIIVAHGAHTKMIACAGSFSLDGVLAYTDDGMHAFMHA